MKAVNITKVSLYAADLIHLRLIKGRGERKSVRYNPLKLHSCLTLQ